MYKNLAYIIGTELFDLLIGELNIFRVLSFRGGNTPLRAKINYNNRLSRVEPTELKFV